MEIDLMDLIALAHVVSAAQETGLLWALQSGPRTAQAIAEELGLDRRAVVLVLDALVTLDVASRDGDAYDASPRFKSLVRPLGPNGERMLGLMKHMATFLRTGEPLFRMDGTPAEREGCYQGSVAWLANMMEPAARELASKLAQPPARILDVGCGSGVWGLTIAERFPQAHVTGQDLPAVLDAFTARARSLSLGGRVATIPGDMHAVELPAGGFDLVLIANVLRLEAPDRAAALLARLAAAVAPGGALVVVDALAGGNPERERSRALYALNLALRTQRGRVHSPAEMTSWLEAAGLGAVETIDLDGGAALPGALGALLARKQP
jgi:ubiquinone/menaquinone biosynthesis C-methylase UbiE